MKPRKTRHVSNAKGGMNKSTAKILSFGLSTLKIILSIAACLCAVQLLSSMASMGSISIPVFVRRVIAYTYMVLNLFTLVAFGYDKSLATFTQSQKRISEQTLLKYCLFGGLCGAIVGMELFHHKTKKTKFVNIVYAIAVLQVIFVWYAFYADELPFIQLIKS